MYSHINTHTHTYPHKYTNPSTHLHTHTPLCAQTYANTSGARTHALTRAYRYKRARQQPLSPQHLPSTCSTRGENYKQGRLSGLSLPSSFRYCESHLSALASQPRSSCRPQPPPFLDATNGAWTTCVSPLVLLSVGCQGQMAGCAREATVYFFLPSLLHSQAGFFARRFKE